ncbi:mucin-22-like [Argopecten irradians]|uniref:mucin-22-like n=1 Tax=Argopecten irradians TaxID=31199 RepID=UPI0037230811
MSYQQTDSAYPVEISRARRDIQPIIADDRKQESQKQSTDIPKSMVTTTKQQSGTTAHSAIFAYTKGVTQTIQQADPMTDKEHQVKTQSEQLNSTESPPSTYPMKLQTKPAFQTKSPTTATDLKQTELEMAKQTEAPKLLAKSTESTVSTIRVNPSESFTEQSSRFKSTKADVTMSWKETKPTNSRRREYQTKLATKVPYSTKPVTEGNDPTKLATKGTYPTKSVTERNDQTKLATKVPYPTKSVTEGNDQTKLATKVPYPTKSVADGNDPTKLATKVPYPTKPVTEGNEPTKLATKVLPDKNQSQKK